MNSAFYLGKVRHRRFEPKNHEFNYPIYLTALDLDEIEHIEKKHWWFSTSGFAPLKFQRKNYLPEGTSNLKNAVIDKAKKLGGDISNIDQVIMLGNLTCFGIYFSPVNFFFCYEKGSAKYLLAEVRNTPWNERHCYLVNLDNPTPNKKSFHVSPFMDLNMEYRWQVREPEKFTRVHIENWRNSLLFDATFAAKRYEFSKSSVTKVLLQWPFMTVSILKGIYWQALKLILKGIRYVQHPVKSKSNAET